METFEIQGGKKLKGEIEVRGSKNATTPILAATLLTKERCIISNIPLIEDVFKMLEILKSMGSEVKWLGERKICIKNDNIYPDKMDAELIKKIRSSILLFGSLSARFDKFQIHHPGGCKIGIRPMDTHFDALRKMGVEVKQNEKAYEVSASKRKPAKIVLKEFSVTGTENAMMLAASLPGKTIIKIAACEPHVEDLGNFLISMGAKIEGLGTHTLEIIGSRKLQGVRHQIIPDANEAATFLIMGVATQSPIKVKNAREEHLDLVLEKLREFGADFKIEKNCITVIPNSRLKAVNKVDARTYPGVPTDVQAPFGVLATQAKGKTLIHDSLYEGRFNYINEINKMGAQAKILNVHQALISGPTKLSGKKINSFDLRAGAALIIAALVAKGKTVIQDIYQVDRGYERIEERLQKLGADIKRVSS
ncbi:MAG: UDP-N-acetylglucosamine 1-carboxyvinyltransferase [Candidatus Moranbacteria bacterium CG06_land_8_20_14_3_00_40_12]|nr:MAG: UDP-N-acetylglucosamine 1-carboxyvinyltransferase [Candidatus Moranbacteria bacterium CG23_combo_of_CG06-09_8_20_14_all_40_16]PIU80386.1 MAG: UDP-N-acetylglucosamine 1-carboxyvinyltransferase [Candidatus Moranbacteria bacterium CG06_land_8_20_14_3_00_40_12]